MLPAAITNIHQAFREIKDMAADTLQEQCRLAARRAMKEVIEHQMHNAIDTFLEQRRVAGLADRRNGSFPSHLVTEVGDLELRIPRTRTFSARSILKTVCSPNGFHRANDLDVFLVRSVYAQGGTSLVADSGRTGQPLDGQ